MTHANDWHLKNAYRAQTVFAPTHGLYALMVCVGEEVGELCAALLGVTKEKKRKAHLTREDVLDAVADAMTYLSLVLYKMGCSSLDHVKMGSLNEWYERKRNAFTPKLVPKLANDMSAIGFVFRRVISLQQAVGSLAHLVEHLGEDGGKEAYESFWFVVERVCGELAEIALIAGCEDLEALIGSTFNAVSERAGSDIRTVVGSSRRTEDEVRQGASGERNGAESFSTFDSEKTPARQVVCECTDWTIFDIPKSELHPSWLDGSPYALAHHPRCPKGVVNVGSAPAGTSKGI